MQRRHANLAWQHWLLHVGMRTPRRTRLAAGEQQHKVERHVRGVAVVDELQRSVAHAQNDLSPGCEAVASAWDDGSHLVSSRGVVGAAVACVSGNGTACSQDLNGSNGQGNTEMSCKHEK